MCSMIRADDSRKVIGSTFLWFGFIWLYLSASPPGVRHSGTYAVVGKGTRTVHNYNNNLKNYVYDVKTILPERCLEHRPLQTSIDHQTPREFAFWRDPNLRDMLVYSTFSTHRKQGSLEGSFTQNPDTRHLGSLRGVQPTTTLTQSTETLKENQRDDYIPLLLLCYQACKHPRVSPCTYIR